MIAQAGSNSRKPESILKLHQERRDWIVDATRSQHAVGALDWIFVRPIFKTPDFVASADIPEHTARGIVRALREHGMLREIVPSSGRAPAILAFAELLNIAESRAAF